MLSQPNCERAPEWLQPTSQSDETGVMQCSDATCHALTVRVPVTCSQWHCTSDCKSSPRELSRTSKTASCTSHKDKLGTNVAQEMLASVLQAASPELLKTKASEALVHLVSSRRPIRLYFIITSRFFSARDEALVILRQKLKC